MASAFTRNRPKSTISRFGLQICILAKTGIGKCRLEDPLSDCLHEFVEVSSRPVVEVADRAQQISRGANLTFGCSKHLQLTPNHEYLRTMRQLQMFLILDVRQQTTFLA